MLSDPAVQDSSEPVLARVAAGDAESIRTCLARYGGIVYALARRHESSDGDVEDAVQEVFVDLWKSAGRFRAESVGSDRGAPRAAGQEPS